MRRRSKRAYAATMMEGGNGCVAWTVWPPPLSMRLKAATAMLKGRICHHRGEKKRGKKYFSHKKHFLSFLLRLFLSKRKTFMSQI
jgi:hypothetical protein